ncbi:MAG: ABC transporter permease, partial [Acidimicrobiales bacterium]
LPANGVGVASYALDEVALPSAQPITFALTQGRAPANDGEVAVGPKTALDLHVRVGDRFELGADHVVVQVVGLALFPPDVHAEFDEGVWVTGSALNAQAPSVTSDDLFQGAERAIVVRFPKGTDTVSAVGALNDRVGDQTQGVAPAEIPAELTNLRNVRTLPLLLAGFLGLLAIAAVSHVLLTSSRRRRRDFAVLRAVGVSRRDTRLMLNAQGTAIGLVGLAVGVPLGVGLGRTGWRWVADRVPLDDVPPFAVVAVVVIVPAAIAIVNALAVWPGRRVSRLHPAEVLRAE